MLRLFLGLFLVMTIGLVLALQTVDRTFDALLDGEMQHYNQEAVRGQAWSLVEQLRGLDDSARERQLETVRPHYGLGLALVERDQLSLSTQEKAELSQGLLVMRDQYTQFISRIDDGSQLLSIKLPAEPSLMPFYITVAYMMIAIMIGFVLFFWVRPHWRDLEKLRLAAERFGGNDLSVRIQLSKRSNIRDLAEHFNLMAARIEGLIANQRELTNAVSHELRTPIARLSFELDQLKQQPDPSQNRELIDDMYADLGELEEMVSELLTYASLEQGATVIVREDIQARDWLYSVVGSVALEAEAAGVQLLIAECPVGVVRIEPRFMARAVINLLRNAIRYADERVQVSLTRAGDHYEVRVNDDGPGVPLDGREKIFEPFSRLDASRDRRTGGFGLGLALVRRVSQSHRGHVEVTDSPWGGASFRMTWAHLD
ncbi:MULTISPECIES: ATP-binding protein [Pseudomonas]|uniref:histidine kinase n=1 Tax=Pseudomonas brassicacearum (strain NFM421) TaxID=994484 RepID=F2K7M8_PSEBN|nr:MULTISPECIES: ATP-binding protein [Pseudomonas]AEA69619.1 putative Histidine kinase, Classic [Pseudomonas brassicacearum subsp. brassicacearum NFM421]AOS42615.1 two-component sensor histidine kinase [Pseudomonas brassicacearum]PJH86347.1 two-component sensor histidine kinase [Pseudomonas sp. WCS365]ROM94741.1 two-component sensor histidine kinase [Pseudomonas brassicacearum]ROM96660.1 two-component sensor histidine kinase [Pseudomonas brassicacearum]